MQDVLQVFKQKSYLMLLQQVYIFISTIFTYFLDDVRHDVMGQSSEVAYEENCLLFFAELSFHLMFRQFSCFPS